MSTRARGRSQSPPHRHRVKECGSGFRLHGIAAERLCSPPRLWRLLKKSRGRATVYKFHYEASVCSGVAVMLNSENPVALSDFDERVFAAVVPADHYLRRVKAVVD